MLVIGIIIICLIVAWLYMSGGGKTGKTREKRPFHNGEDPEDEVVDDDDGYEMLEDVDGPDEPVMIVDPLDF